jgi:NADH-quinone oxidoreductase subunit G
MAKLVTLTIDGVQVSVPAGTLVVDAAKKVGIDIPVFCYHPKMEPVGMCRMCLVEIGRPLIDRTSGELVLEEDGSPKIQFGPKLETACTTRVTEGMVINGMGEKAKAARDDIIEFLLTSHPLDCPICDKGGECPLQNLTIKFGAGESRFIYNEKMHLAKHVPLGELIYLDRERCIQCGRCVRFQHEIADDPVIDFYNRGRSLEIITLSEPGFDSYFSGNTTDICPVGALTTADFRFGARPWELKPAATICSHCPVGCNLTMNIRREAAAGGEWIVKRVMPRQNESVNEIWICDKGRFGHHYAGKSEGDKNNPARLTEPLVRKNADSNHAGELVPVSWDEALTIIADRFKQAGENLLTILGGRLSNEDLFNLNKLTVGLGGETVQYSHMAGGEFTSRYGLPPGSNLTDLGPDDAVLVVACDLEEEAPIWWLRVKQAAERGVKVISLNARSTKIDRVASFTLHYPYGMETAAVLALLNTLSTKPLGLPESVQSLAQDPAFLNAAKVFSQAGNALVLFGSDGAGVEQSQALAQACANLLVSTDHAGRVNNGLIGVWPRANDQGAWELGLRTHSNIHEKIENAQAVYIAAADPAGDDPAYLGLTGFGGDAFIVVQDLYLSQSARLADVVLPALSWIEREGSFTSGDRRVQRFYTVIPDIAKPIPKVESQGVIKTSLLTAGEMVLSGPLADYAIPALIAQKIGGELSLPSRSASIVFDEIARTVPVFSGLSYNLLSETSEQWPIIGREDLYYGGTGYENNQGLGAQLPLAETEEKSSLQLSGSSVEFIHIPRLGQIAFPVNRLYDRGQTLIHSKLILERIGEPFVVISAIDAERIRVEAGGMVQISFDSTSTSSNASFSSDNKVIVKVQISEELPERVALIPRSFGMPGYKPVQVDIRKIEKSV